MALSDNLISYWSLDESSGQATDAHSTNHLADNNTVGTAAGIISNARDFEATNDEYFSIADNAALSTGNIDFTVAGWAKFESVDTTGGYMPIVDKGWIFPVDVNYEFTLWGVSNDGTANRARMEVIVGTADPVGISATTFGAISTGVWYFIVGWHDSVNNLVGISVNDTANTVGHAGGVNDGNREWRIGAITDPAAGKFDGLIDEVGFWKRVLTASEITELYNAGAGRSYSYITGGAAPSAVAPANYQFFPKPKLRKPITAGRVF